MKNISYTYRFFSIAALLLFLCLSVQAKDKAKIEIPFELINGLTVIEAEIDGIHGKYLLDTGSDGIILNGQADADSQGSILSLGGSTKSSTQALKMVRVGEYIQSNLEAQVLDLGQIEDHLGINLKGIIGGYLFQPKVVILDFKNSIITLSDKLAKQERLAFDDKICINTVNQIPVAKIQIEGKWYNFALDSGSSIHFIDTEVVKVLKDVSSTKELSTMKCIANTNEQLSKQIIKHFSMGRLDFSNQVYLPKSFADVNASADIHLDGILSMSQLFQDKVVIDYTRSKLYF